MKFMLIMNSPRDGYTQFMNWPKKILEANFAFMESFTRKLADAGELVSTCGLASPDQAKRVRVGRISQRPYHESTKVRIVPGPTVTRRLGASLLPRQYSVPVCQSHGGKKSGPGR